LQLAISPQPRVLGESISVQSGSQLAVKVEGVIQHGKRPGLFRRVSGVVVTVSSQLQARSAHTNHDSKVRIQHYISCDTWAKPKQFIGCRESPRPLTGCGENQAVARIQQESKGLINKYSCHTWGKM
jgi:hypothetical protein